MRVRPSNVIPAPGRRAPGPGVSRGVTPGSGVPPTKGGGPPGPGPKGMRGKGSLHSAGNRLTTKASPSATSSRPASSSGAPRPIRSLLNLYLSLW